MSCSNAMLNKNINMYSEIWDEIINTGNLDLINDTYFTNDVTLVMSPKNISGIDAFKEYYSNFVTGFSEPKFTIVDIFGQGDKIVKHWKFEGKHTGAFFGIPPTGNSVNIEGVTIAKMKNGKIAQEQDFFDNMTFMQQLGIVSAPENTAIIQKIYDDFAKGDIPAVLSAFDPNIVWNEAEGNAWADGNPYKGPDAILNGVFARVGSEYDYFKTDNVQLHDMSNNQVLATMRYNGKLKKNGVVIDAQAAHLWTLKDGKVVGFQQYVDTKKLHDANSK
jgi:hypothetical protein